MLKTISIASQRDGTGKTSTAVNIASSLAIFEKKTLLIDCDPQGYATVWTGLTKKGFSHNLYHAFIGKVSPADIIHDSDIEFLKIIPAKIDLFLVEHKLAVKPGKEMILRKIVQDISENFEYIIIDTPSSLGFFTICSLAASDWVLVPLRCETTALEDFSYLLEIVQMVRDQLHSGLKLAGILFNMCENINEINTYFTKKLIKPIEKTILATTIPKDTAISDSLKKGKPVALYDVMSNGAESYFDLSKELIQIANTNELK